MLKRLIEASNLSIAIAIIVALPSMALAKDFQWELVAKGEQGAELYVDSASIKTVEAQFRVVIEMLNYVDQGIPRSILSGSLYDCQTPRKKDQFIAQYDGHWGIGTRLSSSTEERAWKTLYPSSMGMGAYKFVCSVHKKKA
jgi:hypothetical protein